jgi:hypothetical protein
MGVAVAERRDTNRTALACSQAAAKLRRRQARPKKARGAQADNKSAHRITNKMAPLRGAIVSLHAIRSVAAAHLADHPRTIGQTLAHDDRAAVIATRIQTPTLDHHASIIAEVAIPPMIPLTDPYRYAALAGSHIELSESRHCSQNGRSCGNAENELPHCILLRMSFGA